MRVALVVTVLLLAGCLGLDPGRKDPPGQSPAVTTTTTTAPGPENPAPPTPSGDIPMLLDFSYNGCAGYEGFWFPPYADIQALLPEGYTAQEESGPQGATAEVQVLMAACDFTTPSATVNDTVFGLVAVLLDSGDAYLLQMLTQDDLLATLWDAAGYDLHTGPWARQVTGDIAAGPLQAGLHDVSLGDYHAQGIGTLGSGDGEEDVTYLTETEAGRLTWTMTQQVASFAGLTGTLTTAGDLFTPGPTDALAAEQRAILDASYTGIDLWLAPTP